MRARTKHRINARRTYNSHLQDLFTEVDNLRSKAYNPEHLLDQEQQLEEIKARVEMLLSIVNTVK